MANHPFVGSFEWAKQIVARDHQQIVEARMSKPIEGSPSLIEHVPRSRERAALDIAIATLAYLRAHDPNRLTVQDALDKIAALVPEAVK